MIAAEVHFVLNRQTLFSNMSDSIYRVFYFVYNAVRARFEACPIVYPEPSPQTILYG